MKSNAIIIGAGPAGLTAALELLERTDIKPIVLEKSDIVGGLSRTIEYKGNRMDVGPHRFFSKSDRVLDWWLRIMPLKAEFNGNAFIHYHNEEKEIKNDRLESKDSRKNMILIRRLTRIYFLRKFFSYPIKLSIETLNNLGFLVSLQIVFSYLHYKIFPISNERSLEDFIINRFGKKLYELFFKDYTRKVWGVPCTEISADWGAQRIKGVSLTKALLHSFYSSKVKKKGKEQLGSASTESSLIEQFLYPEFGPGAFWEQVAQKIESLGGEIHFNQDVRQVTRFDKRIVSVSTFDEISGECKTWEGEIFFSSMPIKDLIAVMSDNHVVPMEVKEIASGLEYRDLINVGVLLRQLSFAKDKYGHYEQLKLKDNWIYIQENDVRVGRITIYNNWGTGMVKDANSVWIGMEYFCNQSDSLWELKDDEIEELAKMELVKIGLCRKEDIADSTVQRMDKTYPAYFGTYDRFDKVKDYCNQCSNLYLIGRNGMHRYNNSDHSVLSAMVAVDNIVAGNVTKENIWAINTEKTYHEEVSKKGL